MAPQQHRPRKSSSAASSPHSRPATRTLLKPPCLKAGDTLALIAPAFHFDEKLYEQGRANLEARCQIRTQVEPRLLEREGYFAGSASRRLDELYNALVNPDIDGVLGIRGGYGCTPIYEELLRKLRRHRNLKPKVVAGYSDLTVLLNGLYQDLGWVTFHAPMVAGRPFREPVPLETATFEKALFTKEPLGSITDPQMTTLREGSSRAPLVGGCLSLLVASLGTSYEIRTEGKILFIEDIGEAPYRLDRMLTHLRHAGKFKKLRGIIFGQMTDCKPHSAAFSDVDALTAVKRCVSDLEIPVVFNFPAGHGCPQATFPLGVPVEIHARKNRKPEVVFPVAGVK